MAQPNQPPVPASKPARSAPLVQIEPRASKKAADAFPVIPPLTDAEVLRKKTYIFWRKLIGFVYTDHSYGAFRRWYLSKLLPDEVLYRWQPYKRGECNRCGLCCKIVYHCPFYVEAEGGTACAIYVDPKHSPSACVVFPIDPKDIQEVQKQISPVPCPFHFEGEPEHPSTWGALKAYWAKELNKRKQKFKEVLDF